MTESKGYIVSERERAYKKHPLTKRRTAQRVNDLHSQIKTELIAYKGGKCMKCGIEATRDNQCIFVFHHRNPSEKDRVVSLYQSLDSAKTEADKCDMLCMNCHALVHYRDDKIAKLEREVLRRFALPTMESDYHIGLLESA